MRVVGKVFRLTTTDDDLRRRGRLTIGIALALLVFTLGLLATQYLWADSSATPLLLICNGLLYLVIAVLARYGWVQTAAAILIAITEIGIIIPMLTATSTSILYFLPLTILLAGTLLGAHSVWIVYAVSMAATAFMGLRDPQLNISAYFPPVLLVSILTVLAYLSAHSTERAFRAAHRARADAETASQALLHANSSLEARVAERTTTLQEALATEQRLNATITQLSAPILPVRHDTLAVPVIGQLNATRVQMLLDTILQAITRTQAREIILDITGVSEVDTMVAQGLLQIASGARLLGATTILVGCRAEVAQTLVSLGNDLSAIHTVATLQAALEARPLAEQGVGRG